jgi:zinc transport system ATP-binding protein
MPYEVARACQEQLIVNATTADELLDMRGVGVRAGARWLVRGVDLAVRRGEIVTVIGPNGSGKSTTVKAALGILRPDEGKVRQFAGLKVGYVPQRLPIDWSMPLTVDRLMTLSGPVTPREAGAALERTGIPHLRRAELQTLSGGEFQRALLARAIARRPDLLVLDEPVQGVDFSGEIALYELISQIRAETGCGILLISHDLHVVMAATDTVVCLNGHVCCSGSPEQVASSADYQMLFGHRGGRTLAIYRHEHDHTHLPDGRVRHADGHVSDDHHAHGDHCSHGEHDARVPAPTAADPRELQDVR